MKLRCRNRWTDDIWRDDIWREAAQDAGDCLRHNRILSNQVLANIKTECGDQSGATMLTQPYNDNGRP